MGQGRAVLVCMSWPVCLGLYVLVCMSWPVCLGLYVLACMSWPVCLGLCVLGLLPWFCCLGLPVRVRDLRGPNAPLHLRRGHRRGAQPKNPTPRRQVQALVRRATWDSLPCGLPMPPGRVGRADDAATPPPGPRVVWVGVVLDALCLGCLVSWMPCVLDALGLGCWPSWVSWDTRFASCTDFPLSWSSRAPLAPNARGEPPRHGGWPPANTLPLARSAPVRG